MKIRRTLCSRAVYFGIAAGVFALASTPARAQLFDPQNGMILSVLREISVRHQLGLQEQRMQTAKLVQQLKAFYDSYTLIRRDFEFTQSLYRDFKAIDNLKFHNTFAVSNLIINGDRLNYWLPSTSQQVSRSAMDTESLLRNADQLKKTYDSFAVSTDEESVPANAEQRRQNALAGQDAFMRALFEQSLRSQRMAVTYDSLAAELYRQVLDKQNKFTEAERTQLLVESVKMRDLANTHYEKYLQLSEQVLQNASETHDQKLDFLRSKVNWKQLGREANKISNIRYGFFDLLPGEIR